MIGPFRTIAVTRIRDDSKAYEARGQVVWVMRMVERENASQPPILVESELFQG